MRLAVLFSGGKDSAFAAYLAKKQNHDLTCLISINSKNPDSYMFHTPSITKVKKQAQFMGVPLVEQSTEGKEETELKDLQIAINKAIKKYSIQGIVTGAIESVYQSVRIQKICNSLGLEVFNPLWQKDQLELLDDLIKNEFEVIITGVAAYGLDASWLGKTIDKQFIKNIALLNKKYKINPAGEGGEFESFVVNCPLFSKKIMIKGKTISGSGNNYRMEVLL
ncbi:MAG: diphthine--ammonia ligase [Nanoarchaeota archaeon]